jgi:alkylhydroperoxidase family enzyme
MRIEPLTPPYQPAIDARLRKWMPPGAAIDPLVLFRVLMRNQPLSDSMFALGAYFLGPASGITIRDRELVIDCVCARCHCEYEWGVHAAAFAQQAGFDQTQIEATVTGAPVWSDREQLLVRMVDQLHDHSRIADALWAQLAAHYDSEQLLTLVALAGWYHVVSFIANSAALSNEPWAATFPAGSTAATIP